MQAVLGTGVIAGFSKLSSYVAATYMSGAQDNEKVAVLNKEAHLETVPTPDTGSQGYLQRFYNAAKNLFPSSAPEPTANINVQSTITEKQKVEELQTVSSTYASTLMASVPKLWSLIQAHPEVVVATGLTGVALGVLIKTGALSKVGHALKSGLQRLYGSGQAPPANVGMHTMEARNLQNTGIEQPPPQTTRFTPADISSRQMQGIMTRGARKLQNMSAEPSSTLFSRHKANYLSGTAQQRFAAGSRFTAPASRNATPSQRNFHALMTKRPNMLMGPKSIYQHRSVMQNRHALQSHVTRTRAQYQLAEQRKEFVDQQNRALSKLNEKTTNHVMDVIDTAISAAGNTVGQAIEKGGAAGRYEAGKMSNDNPIYAQIIEAGFRVVASTSNLNHEHSTMNEMLTNWTRLEDVGKVRPNLMQSEREIGRQMFGKIKSELHSRKEQLKHSLLHFEKAQTSMSTYNNQLLHMKEQVDAIEAAVTLLDDKKLMKATGGSRDAKLISAVLHQSLKHDYTDLYKDEATGYERTKISDIISTQDEVAKQIKQDQDRNQQKLGNIGKTLNQHTEATDTMMFDANGVSRREDLINQEENKEEAQNIISDGFTQKKEQFQTTVQKSLLGQATTGSTDGRHDNINNSTLANREGTQAQSALKSEANLQTITPLVMATAKSVLANKTQDAQLISAVAQTVQLWEDIKEEGIKQFPGEAKRIALMESGSNLKHLRSGIAQGLELNPSLARNVGSKWHQQTGTLLEAEVMKKWMTQFRNELKQGGGETKDRSLLSSLVGKVTGRGQKNRGVNFNSMLINSRMQFLAKPEENILSIAHDAQLTQINKENSQKIVDQLTQYEQKATGGIQSNISQENVLKAMEVLPGAEEIQRLQEKTEEDFNMMGQHIPEELKQVFEPAMEIAQQTMGEITEHFHEGGASLPVIEAMDEKMGQMKQEDDLMKQDEGEIETKMLSTGQNLQQMEELFDNAMEQSTQETGQPPGMESQLTAESPTEALTQLNEMATQPQVYPPTSQYPPGTSNQTDATTGSMYPNISWDEQ